jgi:hypothetical protein
MTRFAPIALLALAACSPQAVADQLGRRAAETVVMPVMAEGLPSGPAQAATTCIVQNATAAEVQALARDVAVVAGTLTKATIRAIAARPEAQACFAAKGVQVVV